MEGATAVYTHLREAPLVGGLKLRGESQRGRRTEEMGRRGTSQSSLHDSGVKMEEQDDAVRSHDAHSSPQACFVPAASWSRRRGRELRPATVVSGQSSNTQANTSRPRVI